MSAKVEVKQNLLHNLAAQTTLRVAAIVQETAAHLVEDAKTNIRTGAKSGRVYTSGPPPLPHQASAPGQSPANWTGALADSITHTPLSPTEAEVRVGTGYGVFLEYGTVKMAPRPFLTPAVDAARPRFGAALAALFGKPSPGSSLGIGQTLPGREQED